MVRIGRTTSLCWRLWKGPSFCDWRFCNTLHSTVFYPTGHWPFWAAKKVCVQTSHLALMASNRSSICDIWFHKTINSNREIVNSTQTGCIFPFQTRQPHFTSNCREKANWEQSLQRFSISASCSTFLRDGNENSKCSLRIHWLKIELDNIWLEAHGCEENTDIIQCDQSSQAKVGGADPRKKFIGKNSKTP